jgi:hypothetical protein
MAGNGVIVMKKSDDELIKELRAVFKRFLDDQASPKPTFRPSQVAGEIHGNLADMIFIDKVENETLVYFVLELVNVASDGSDEEILKQLKNIYATLDFLSSEQAK